MAAPHAPQIKGPPPPSDEDRPPRALRNVADTMALARVYAAAYQGHASYGFSDGDCRSAARDAAHHFVNVISERAP